MDPLLKALYEEGKRSSSLAIRFGSAAFDRNGNLIALGHNCAPFHPKHPDLESNRQKRNEIDYILRHKAQDKIDILKHIDRLSIGDNVRTHAEMHTIFNMFSGANNISAKKLEDVSTIAVLAVHPTKDYYGIRKNLAENGNVAESELFACNKCSRVMVALDIDIQVITKQGWVTIPPLDALKQSQINLQKRRQPANDNEERFSWAGQAKKLNQGIRETDFMIWTPYKP